MSYSGFVSSQNNPIFGGPMTHSPAPMNPGQTSAFAGISGSVFGTATNNNNKNNNNNNNNNTVSNNNSNNNSVDRLNAPGMFNNLSRNYNNNNNNNASSSGRSSSNNNKKKSQNQNDDQEVVVPPSHREGTAVVVPNAVANSLFSGDSVLVNNTIMTEVTTITEKAAKQPEVDPIERFASAGVDRGIPYIFADGVLFNNGNALDTQQIRHAFANKVPGQPFTATWLVDKAPNASCDGIFICHLFKSGDRNQYLGPLVMLRVEADSQIASFLQRENLYNPNTECSYAPFLLPYLDTAYVKIQFHRVPNAIEYLHDDFGSFGMVGNPEKEFGIADTANKYIGDLRVIYTNLERARALSQAAQLARPTNSVAATNNNFNNNINNNNTNNKASIAPTTLSSIEPSVQIIQSQQANLNNITNQIKNQIDNTNNSIAQLQNQVSQQLLNHSNNNNNALSSMSNGLQSQIQAMQQQQRQMIDTLSQQINAINASFAQNNNNNNNGNNNNNTTSNNGNGASWGNNFNYNNSNNSQPFGYSGAFVPRSSSRVSFSNNNNNNNNGDDDDDDDEEDDNGFVNFDPATWYIVLRNQSNFSSNQFLEEIFISIFSASIDGVSQIIRNNMAQYRRGTIDFIIREDPCFNTLLSFVDLAAHNYHPRDPKWANFTALARNALLSLRARASNVPSKTLIDNFKVKTNPGDVGGLMIASMQEAAAKKNQEENKNKPRGKRGSSNNRFRSRSNNNNFRNNNRWKKNNNNNNNTNNNNQTALVPYDPSTSTNFSGGAQAMNGPRRH